MAPRKYGRRRRVMRRPGVRRGLRLRGMRMRRRLINPQPTFVETYAGAQINANAGGVFQARITDIPQIAQYSTLYKQYRINWIKVMLIPAYGYSSSDANAALYNNANAVPYVGTARIAFAINDSPDTQAPANEGAVLTDNGCKIQSIVNKWSASFRPVPSVDVLAVGAAAGIATKQKYKQWFNFDTVTIGNNPLHQGISYWITQTLGPGANGVFNLYYKVNFSLRDPQ